jgi:hypothetical protein
MSEEAIGVAKWLVGIDTGGTFTDLRVEASEKLFPEGVCHPTSP